MHEQELHAARYEKYLDGEATSIIDAKRQDERERSGLVMRPSGRLSRPKRSVSNEVGRTYPASELVDGAWNGVPSVWGGVDASANPRGVHASRTHGLPGRAPEVVLRDKLLRMPEIRRMMIKVVKRVVDSPLTATVSELVDAVEVPRDTAPNIGRIITQGLREQLG